MSRWCLSPSLYSREGGHVQQALVSLSIGNDPLYPEDKLTHTYLTAFFMAEDENNKKNIAYMSN
jgi:hypothetical protein